MPRGDDGLEPRGDAQRYADVGAPLNSPADAAGLDRRPSAGTRGAQPAARTRTVLHSENTRTLTARFAHRAEPGSHSRERRR